MINNKPNKIHVKECNAVLQNKLTKVTHVLPKEEILQTQYEPSTGIVYSVKPFYLIMQILGMQQLSFDGNKMVPSSKLAKSYTFLIASIISAAQTYVLIINYSDISDATSPANVVTDLLKLIPPTISAVVCYILSATSFQVMIIRIFENFKIVDRQLDIQSKNIYRPLRIKLMLLQGFATLLTIGMYIYDYWVTDSPRERLQLHLSSFIVSINEFILIEICLLLHIVTSRLDVMNTQLNATKYDVSKLFNNEVSIVSQKKNIFILDSLEDAFLKKDFSKKKQEEQHEDDVIRLMKVYDRLADNANIVNSCFGIPLLNAAIASFMNILSTVTSLIKNNNSSQAETGLLNVNLALWCLRDVLVVVLVTVVIENMLGSVKKTSNIINKLSISSKTDPSREELLDRFSQLMACRKYTITACNFFPFDFTFIYSLVGAIATYTVIILQSNPAVSTKKEVTEKPGT